jgi:acyl dehydratase
MSTPAPDDWPIPEEMKKWLGHEFELGREAVEAGAIRKFAEAYMDPNPLWRDQEYAEKTPWSGIIAPPTFFHCLQSIGYARFDMPMPWEKFTGLNGGNTFEIYEPLRPGDVISGKARVVDIYGRVSKRLGPTIFYTVEMTYTNQKGEVVARQRSITIRYEAKG